MKIFLCRHGQTTGDLEDRFGGDFDDELSKDGLTQANELAKKLSDLGIEIVFSSPRIRALQTAKIVAKRIKSELIVVNDLRERNAYGVLTGIIKSEAKKKYPIEVAKIKKDKLRHKVTNSEDYDLFKERILNEFLKITSSNEYKNICIISHGGPISCLVRELFKLGEFKQLGDCSILEISFENDKFCLLSLNNAELEINPKN